MKNLKLLLLLLVVLGSTLSSEAKVISFGPTAAINKANFSIKGDDGAISNKMGYQFGFDISANLPMISVTPSLLYSNNGFTVMNSMTGDVPVDVKSRNLSVPVIFGFKLLGALSIEGGPVFVLKEWNSAEANVSYGSFSSSISSDDIGTLRKRDSYILGARLTLGNLSMYGRYQQGFGTTSTIFGDMKYGSYSIGAGIRF